MSFYYLGQPDPEDPHRWAFNIGVNSTRAILDALHQAGFRVSLVRNSESISPYLDELDISKPGATREEVEQVCAAADPAPRPGWPLPAKGGAKKSAR